MLAQTVVVYAIFSWSGRVTLAKAIAFLTFLSLPFVGYLIIERLPVSQNDIDHLTNEMRERGLEHIASFEFVTARKRSDENYLLKVYNLSSADEILHLSPDCCRILISDLARMTRWCSVPFRSKSPAALLAIRYPVRALSGEDAVYDSYLPMLCDGSVDVESLANAIN